ncbi:glycosyl transferase family 1 [Microcella alkaliphila]|uniref:Glycosyl transferase family 1 n=1 Tax=Microcella alkaliphila TaxID=279828 RepID=A0A4Q7TC82_9MICO|nr:glycosyltransferase [Microcella alkaliphila]RZT58055.1 glycosyl transferase family 1 [Microcella alkaliphila]
MTLVGRASAIIPDPVLAALLPEGRRFDPGALPPRLELDSTAVTRIAIGAENAAGQGAAWAESLRRHAPGVSARSFAVDRGAAFGHEVDLAIPAPVFAWSARWQKRHRRQVLDEATHVLIEGGRPIFAGGIRGDVVDDARRVRRAGAHLAYVWHGSDVRDPDAHAARSAESPFATGAVGPSLHRALRARVDASARLRGAVPAPSLVSTPDLLLDIPDARWLPLVVDVEAWRGDGAPFSRDRRPVVMHAPSRAALKGSAVIDRVLGQLADDGVIDYRRVSGMSHGALPAIVAEVDVVVDQVGLGLYGVLACEAMAAGRVVVGDPSQQVRDVVRNETGFELPISVTSAAELERSIRSMCADPAVARERAAAGPAFVRAVHDGRRAAATLADALGLEPPSSRMDA